MFAAIGKKKNVNGLKCLTSEAKFFKKVSKVIAYQLEYSFHNKDCLNLIAKDVCSLS